MIKLRPCPFCKNVDVFLERGFGDLIYVKCDKCRAQGPWYTFARKHGKGKTWADNAAAQAWNGDPPEFILLEK